MRCCVSLVYKASETELLIATTAVSLWNKHDSADMLAFQQHFELRVRNDINYNTLPISSFNACYSQPVKYVSMLNACWLALNWVHLMMMGRLFAGHKNTEHLENLQQVTFDSISEINIKANLIDSFHVNQLNNSKTFHHKVKYTVQFWILFG